MPNRDGTGPRGNGPLTGRGLGPCRGKRRTLGRSGHRSARRFGPARRRIR